MKIEKTNEMNTPMHSRRTLRKRRKGRRNGVKLDLLEQRSISNSMREVIGSKVGGYAPPTSSMRSKKEASGSLAPRRAPGRYSNPSTALIRLAHASIGVHRGLYELCTSPPLHRTHGTLSVIILRL
jgi:hypothetical protein